jgi:hypothetical protein
VPKRLEAHLAVGRPSSFRHLVLLRSAGWCSAPSTLQRGPATRPRVGGAFRYRHPGPSRNCNAPVLKPPGWPTRTMSASTSPGQCPQRAGLFLAILLHHGMKFSVYELFLGVDEVLGRAGRRLRQCRSPSPRRGGQLSASQVFTDLPLWPFGYS